MLWQRYSEPLTPTILTAAKLWGLLSVPFGSPLFTNSVICIFDALRVGEGCIKSGRGLVDNKLVEAPPPPPPSNFIAGRSKAALLFWFFGDFRCGTLLFMVILVIYK